MMNYSPEWPHGELSEVFDGIYVVRGTNIICHEGMEIQHSRNMTVIAEGDELTLINSVRLDANGLQQLDKLGNVKNIIRIGAFHGRDDSFYLDRYQCDFWAFDDAEIADHCKITHVLSANTKLPIADSQFIAFANASPKEGVIYLAEHAGVVITCDSIKNWVEVDEFFSEETGKMALASGEIASARISPMWLGATGVKREDFEPVMGKSFAHLISAHGDVLFDTAYDQVKQSIFAIK